ncbi:ABC transporter ATP-binding protein [Deinococcus radiodurans]|jgi:ABC-type multidrug transport system, ATPase component|uniref:ABC transporter, ATP-binding protein n=1 Tax=Deinococcus radiodurans (strain ATCC 13939 / DSM 20539 / JCM 16871 / CCUG 27074 / LMG 4051 / NBRC 15346 / NCIMB 9279 / VKM B-1422 / R1) TaxID=243230 RepID=Q9RS11_DEIRA|nr:ABC transporter ATP-binding protein [Deinococcus radiodurans]AAF11860.1 ABC transporter, ATP-binding protein [Deinococcus radiodurans R1 = ATCC 13939 = DSM 20539]ANC70630.1 ABC transporter [Deinococcus radiodurans R1 = ATCC 13939 = DSM 20539]QEM71696.1 ABC transporter ATP-binding protein [Deinococcus radiodurans]QIP27987.1 ABC transporter ATP-binding protein [Deinococcus radiodurans]QIP31131.1 ABC transporter ATP-binding protein [Deinococcus radiodurans]
MSAPPETVAGAPGNVIETRELRKVYRDRAVVDGLTLTVGAGEVFGFLGPNGAGKSTTVKMLLGLVIPSGGEARVLCGSPADPAVRARLGFLPEQFRFQLWMTAEEFLNFHGQLAGMKSNELRTRVPQVLEEVGLGGRGGEQLSGYSKGMLQRCGLAGAILARPQLVFLDEPTSALDPIGRVEVREIIERLKGEGVAVFLNSHLLSEVEQVCDRVAFVKAGRVLQQGSMRELMGGVIPVSVRVDRLTSELRAALQGIGEIHREDTNTPGRADLDLWLQSEAQVPAVAAAIHAAGAQLYALTPRRPDLESLFLELIEGPAGHAHGGHHA